MKCIRSNEFYSTENKYVVLEVAVLRQRLLVFQASFIVNKIISQAVMCNEEVSFLRTCNLRAIFLEKRPSS